MRRGEKPPPVYAASKLGSARTLPFKRPAADSLPKFSCGVKGCGTRKGTVDTRLTVANAGHPLMAFCSWGCVSRFAIRQELRS